MPAGRAIFGLTIFVLGFGLFGWTWAHISAIFAAAVLGLWFFQRHFISVFSGIKTVPISFGRIISYSWPLSISTMAILLMDQVNVLFLGYFQPSPAEISIYRIYFQLLMVMIVIKSSFALIGKPVITELTSINRIEEGRLLYQRISKWIFIINSYCLLAVFLNQYPVHKCLSGHSGRALYPGGRPLRKFHHRAGWDDTGSLRLYQVGSG